MLLRVVRQRTARQHEESRLPVVHDVALLAQRALPRYCLTVCAEAVLARASGSRAIAAASTPTRGTHI